jgi:hypothetical protein
MLLLLLLLLLSVMQLVLLSRQRRTCEGATITQAPTAPA